MICKISLYLFIAFTRVDFCRFLCKFKFFIKCSYEWKSKMKYYTHSSFIENVFSYNCQGKGNRFCNYETMCVSEKMLRNIVNKRDLSLRLLDCDHQTIVHSERIMKFVASQRDTLPTKTNFSKPFHILSFPRVVPKKVRKNRLKTGYLESFGNIFWRECE